MIYIAAPFFKTEQVAMVEQIEKALSLNGYGFYSPRSDGILLDLPETERQSRKRIIYDTNIMKLLASDSMIAVIDDRDIGTIWEMGYGKAIGLHTVTISSKSYGLNVMLAESVQAHVLNTDDMIKALLDTDYKGELQTEVT